MLKLEKKPNYMTVSAALLELDKIEMVRINNGSYHLDHAITKTQKIILSSFGMDENEVNRMATEISQKLAYDNSLINPNDSEAEYEEDEIY